MRMLVRRGFRPAHSAVDVPFSDNLDQTTVEKLSNQLSHYAFRLFFRGAIQRGGGFRPSETTRYLTGEQSKVYAEVLADLGLAERIAGGRYRLKYAARSFGGTLEWYVARELERRFGFDVVTGIKLHTRGTGGDLDVVAAAEGKLVYLELKSSPPRNLAENEITAFCDRVSSVQPDLALFVIDTALRLSDKVVPMFVEEFSRRGYDRSGIRSVGGQIWAVTPRVYIVNGSRDLMKNIGRAIAAGLRALSQGIFSQEK